MTANPTKILLAVPMHNGALDFRHATSYRPFYDMGRARLWAALSNVVAADAGMHDKQAAMKEAQDALQADPIDGISWRVSSLLAFGFNSLFREALRRRESHRVTHFLMLHADVAVSSPRMDQGWPERMLEIMQQHGLDVLSATVSLKVDGGETSTAIDADDDIPEIRRLTVADTAGKTITSRECPRLLINTGCMLVDITKPWADDVCFTVNDEINDDGVAVVHPEDWSFSRWLRERGVAYGATGEVLTHHIGGRTEWRNL